MYKSKKMMAVALVAVMVMGSTMTVFADDTPSTTGGTSGTGSSEGHVEKEVLNMVLPTIPSGSTPFAYTMDPERLIQETGGAKYEDYTFPAKESDTGVYFLTGDKTYANTSSALQAINKSSCDVTLTVKVQAIASAGGKDITLAAAATPSATDAELYLGLNVGASAAVVSTSEATVTKTIAGAASNFETVYDSTASAYKYQEKADATTWKAINISMTGAVSSKAIAADTTAPTVDVTWSYAKAAEGVTVDTTDQVDYIATPVATNPAISNVTAFTKETPNDVVITFSLGTGDKAVDADGIVLKQGANKTTVNVAKYKVDMNAGTVTIDKSANFMASATENVPIYVILTKGSNEVKELSGTIEIK